MLVFSPEGLTNEYIERARAIRGGRVMEVESLTELEGLRFPLPFGRLEAFATSGGASTLPSTMLGRVRELRVPAREFLKRVRERGIVITETDWGGWWGPRGVRREEGS
ncbi:MAG: hypothetical protein ACUVV6_01385 [Thermoplasmatota archaeon]